MKRHQTFILILCNLIWSFNPIAGKVLIVELGSLEAAWVRIFGAWLMMILMVICLRSWKEINGGIVAASSTDWRWIAAISVATCFYTPLVQMSGLQVSSAASGAILIACEPMITLLLGWIVLREAIRGRDGLALGLSLIGVFILSGGVQNVLNPRESVWSWGEWVIVISIFGDAAFTVFAKAIHSRIPNSLIYGSALSVGLILTSILLIGLGRLPVFWSLSAHGWIAAAWIGPIGSALTYWLWMRAARDGVQLSRLALSLMIQPVMGALGGMMLLGEPILMRQILGGALICISVFIHEWTLKNKVCAS